MRLVLAGLDADEAGRSAEASSLYERALQVDPTNPYAWLALARQEVFEGDPDRGLADLDKAESLLTSDDASRRAPGRHPRRRAARRRRSPGSRSRSCAKRASARRRLGPTASSTLPSCGDRFARR